MEDYFKVFEKQKDPLGYPWDMLPFQDIELVDESRSEKDRSMQGTLFDMDASGRQLRGWTKKLILSPKIALAVAYSDWLLAAGKMMWLYPNLIPAVSN